MKSGFDANNNRIATTLVAGSSWALGTWGGLSLAGRDHWPDASFALFAGAVRTGQVVGQTDSRAERPVSRAYSAPSVIGTVYHALGIDYRQTLNDFAGRPMQLLDDGEPISELP